MESAGSGRRRLRGRPRGRRRRFRSGDLLGGSGLRRTG